MHAVNGLCTSAHMLIQNFIRICICSEFEWMWSSNVCVFLQESLLDADHHVAVALGPADKPHSAVRTNNIHTLSMRTLFSLGAFSSKWAMKGSLSVVMGKKFNFSHIPAQLLCLKPNKRCAYRLSIKLEITVLGCDLIMKWCHRILTCVAVVRWKIKPQVVRKKHYCTF